MPDIKALISPLHQNLVVAMSFISMRHFGYGLIGVVLLYTALFGYAFLTGPRILQNIESQFEQKTIHLASDYPASHTSSQAHTAIQAGIPHSKTLPAAPFEGLYETVRGHTIPKKGANEATPFLAYKRPVSHIKNPVIALALHDFGLSEKRAAAALEHLPEDITFILSPYAANLDGWQKKARQKGHETWLEIPVQTNETGTYKDTGAYTLLAQNNADRNIALAHELMGSTSGYAGIALFADDFLAAQPQSLISSLNEIFNRGLGVFDVNPAGNAILQNIARRADAPYIKTTSASLGLTLNALEVAAKTNGYAVAYVPPFPKNIEALKNWVDTLGQKHIQLVPLSAVYGLKQKKREAAPPPDITEKIVPRSKTDAHSQNDIRSVSSIHHE
jgi:polysaccharide deacetylase 2 family uncharacterized protein YibQ